MEETDFGPWIYVQAGSMEMPRELAGVKASDWQYRYSSGRVGMVIEPEERCWDMEAGISRIVAYRIRRKPVLTTRETAEGWVEHRSNERPCAADMRIDVKLRSGRVMVDNRSDRWAACWSTENSTTEHDIVAWRLAKTEPSNPTPTQAEVAEHLNAAMLARDIPPATPAPTQTLRWPQPWCPESNLMRVAPMSVRGLWGERS